MFQRIPPVGSRRHDDVVADPEALDSRGVDASDTGDLFAALGASNPSRRSAAREALVLRFLPLAYGLARRYADRGIPLEDLRQVAALALIKAIDRFDPAHGFPFPTFACPTIIGELKRHFRDLGWTLKVSRRVKDHRYDLVGAEGFLAQRLGRQPTSEELSQTLGLPLDDVRELMTAQHAYSVTSLEAMAAANDRFEVAELLVAHDPDLEAAEAFHTLRPALARLPERDRLVIAWRFYEGVSQSVVAGRLGISQMHVSRLQARALARLRHLLGTIDAPAEAGRAAAMAS